MPTQIMNNMSPGCTDIKILREYSNRPERAMAPVPIFQFSLGNADTFSMILEKTSLGISPKPYSYDI